MAREPKGIKIVYDYANKFIKDVKDEDLATLENYFVCEFEYVCFKKMQLNFDRGRIYGL